MGSIGSVSRISIVELRLSPRDTAAFDGYFECY